MKIDVTYEKDDILRLVCADLERRDIKVKAGTVPEYKGALHVKLSIEADEVNEATPRAQAAASLPVRENQDAGEDPPIPVVNPEDTIDMEAVLNQSRRVSATTKPTFKTAPNNDELKRTLGKNESLEFPREE